MIRSLSYSRIAAYLRCHAYLKHNVNLEVLMATPIDLAFGTCVHNVVSMMLVAKCMGHSQLHLPSAWELEWNTAVNERYIDFGSTPPETHENIGYKIFAKSEIADELHKLTPLMDPNKQPLVDRRFDLVLPETMPIVGYIDTILDDGIITDFKTAAYKWTQDKANMEVQPLIYLIAAKVLGLPHLPNTFRHIVVTKSANPVMQVIYSTHTDSEIDFIYGVIRDVSRGIESGDFRPNPTACYSFNRLCEFYSICRGKLGNEIPATAQR